MAGRKVPRDNAAEDGSSEPLRESGLIDRTEQGFGGILQELANPAAGTEPKPTKILRFCSPKVIDWIG